MFIPIVFAQLTLNIIITVSVLSALIIVFWLEMLIMKKNEHSIKKIVIIIIYSTSFLLMIAGLLYILDLWGIPAYEYTISYFEKTAQSIKGKIPELIGSFVVIFISFFVLKISKITLNRIAAKNGPNQKRKVTITKIIRSLFKYFIFIFGLLIILSLWGLDVAPALAGLGILGLVIGLGAQKFINDLISGFFIVFEDHFSVGDRIEVQGFKGDVTDIGLKTTKLMNWKGDMKIVSNGEISTLINYSRNFSIAVVEFGISYKENIQSVTDLLNAELPQMRKEYPVIVEDPVVLGVTQLADSSVNIRVIAKTECEQHYAVQRELLNRIKIILDQNNIEIPFPQIVVHNT